MALAPLDLRLFDQGVVFAAAHMQQTFQPGALALDLAQTGIALGAPLQGHGEVHPYRGVATVRSADVAGNALCHRHARLQPCALQGCGDLVPCVEFQLGQCKGRVLVGPRPQRVRVETRFRPDHGQGLDGGLGQIGQACQFTEVQRLLCALVVTARLHHVEQTQQFQFFCLQQHAGRPAGFQLGPCLGTHTQKGLRNTNALCGAQVPRIGPSHGLHGFLSRQAQSHLPLRHREFGLAHAAQLRIAAPEQRPAHTKLDVEALVVAAEGVGHGFARGADTGATKNPCSLAGAGRAVAVRCHVLFSLGQLDRRGCHKRQVFQFGQGGAGIGQVRGSGRHGPRAQECKPEQQGQIPERVSHGLFRHLRTWFCAAPTREPWRSQGAIA